MKSQWITDEKPMKNQWKTDDNWRNQSEIAPAGSQRASGRAPGYDGRPAGGTCRENRRSLGARARRTCNHSRDLLIVRHVYTKQRASARTPWGSCRRLASAHWSPQNHIICSTEEPLNFHWRILWFYISQTHLLTALSPAWGEDKWCRTPETYNICITKSKNFNKRSNSFYYKVHHPTDRNEKAETAETAETAEKAETAETAETAEKQQSKTHRLSWWNRTRLAP